MSIKITLGSRGFNTKYAPLAVLGYKYRQSDLFTPLGSIHPPIKEVQYNSQIKLEQILVSMLAGCRYISEINPKLRTEQKLAEVWQFPGFADQSQLSEYLNRLTLANLVELEANIDEIWRSLSYLLEHDWRRILVVDYDLSGLPCSKHAEGSKKGYMSGKKTKQGDN